MRRPAVVRPSYLRVVEHPDDLVATGNVDLGGHDFIFAVYDLAGDYRAQIGATPDRVFETIDTTLEGALVETIDYAEECLAIAPLSRSDSRAPEDLPHEAPDA
jgi:hypothetical protein